MIFGRGERHPRVEEKAESSEDPDGFLTFELLVLDNHFDLSLHSHFFDDVFDGVGEELLKVNGSTVKLVTYDSLEKNHEHIKYFEDCAGVSAD